MFDLNKTNSAIGVDVENISRFKELDIDKDADYVNKIFTEKELDYCFFAGIPGQHLAVRFAGKEAVIKALSALGRANLGYKEIEIINDEKGIPRVSILKKGSENLDVQLSLSHSEDIAIAFTIVTLRADGQG